MTMRFSDFKGKILLEFFSIKKTKNKNKTKILQLLFWKTAEIRC